MIFSYLELPPDLQKITKRPNTNVISDKDRVATTRTPQPDPKELKKIIASAHPGRPGRPARKARRRNRVLRSRRHRSRDPGATARNSAPPQPSPSNQIAQLRRRRSRASGEVWWLDVGGLGD